MDIALMLDILVPNADFQGSVTANNRHAYDRMRWIDPRPKPTWEALETRWQQYLAEPSLTEVTPQSALKEIVTQLEGKNIKLTLSQAVRDWLK